MNTFDDNVLYKFNITMKIITTTTTTTTTGEKYNQWRKRWFVLSNGCLFYFTHKTVS